jgi:hypothetical protein
MRYAWLLLILLSILLIQGQDVPETVVEFLELSDSAAEPDAELSSLIWFGDTLLLIAENPQRYAEDDNFGSFFALEKTAILDYLRAENPRALAPETIAIYADGLIDRLRERGAIFDGFEAVAIRDTTIYLQIECFTTSVAPQR